MTVEEIKELLKSPKYDFLRDEECLGENIIFLAISGSHAQGTNHEKSDVDIRGIALNSKEEILLGKDFGCYIDTESDTTIYSVKKALFELSESNPNFLEMLFVKPEHILYMSDLGRIIYENKRSFLSKDCFRSFVCYAKDQLRRLDNKSMRTQSQEKQELHILNSLQSMEHSFKKKYTTFENDSIHLYVDDSNRKDMNTEIFMDVHLTHYPLRDYKAMWNEMNNVVKEYNKVGKRAKNAILHEKVNKHAGHLVRLLHECMKILTYGDFCVYDEDINPIVKEIKNKNPKYMLTSTECTEEFYEFVRNLEEKAKEAFETSTLPDMPDLDKIKDLEYTIHDLVIRMSYEA